MDYAKREDLHQIDCYRLLHRKFHRKNIGHNAGAEESRRINKQLSKMDIFQPDKFPDTEAENKRCVDELAVVSKFF